MAARAFSRCNKAQWVIRYRSRLQYTKLPDIFGPTMIHKGRPSRTPPIYLLQGCYIITFVNKLHPMPRVTFGIPDLLFKFQSKFMFCKCKTVFLLLYSEAPEAN